MPKKVTKKSPNSRTAPEGDTRLVVNIRKDLHKRLKHAAVDQETTAGDIIEGLIEKHVKPPK